jgi:hypothetical protein
MMRPPIRTAPMRISPHGSGMPPEESGVFGPGLADTFLAAFLAAEIDRIFAKSGESIDFVHLGAAWFSVLAFPLVVFTGPHNLDLVTLFDLATLEFASEACIAKIFGHVVGVLRIFEPYDIEIGSVLFGSHDLTLVVEEFTHARKNPCHGNVGFDQPKLSA